jgi:predicted TIM-barrel fold metal-dependent hydrolase
MDLSGLIDADTHVDETDATWDYMEPKEQSFKPVTEVRYNPNSSTKHAELREWVVEGIRTRRPVRNDSKSGTKVGARELLDVESRLRHMDELGTEIQVIYPTFFLHVPAATDAGQVALARSYNRWLADRCSVSKGRLRWVCIPPLVDIAASIKELQVAKENGACGVFKKGDREAGREPNDPYFFPLYEEAERLDMPICFHTGGGTTEVRGGLLNSKAPAINGIYSLLEANVPAQFPHLRIGCVEAGASWVPFADYQLRRLHDRHAMSSNEAGREFVFDVTKDLFKSNRVYVACQVDEDISMILNYISEDNLLMGSDYTHQDTSHELEFRRMLEERVGREEVPASVAHKITHDNPRAFYGL